MLNQFTLRQTYELVGEATTAWNQVEGLWFLIFTALMRDTERDITDALYDMFQTGAMQRQLIMKVAPIALKYDLKGLKRQNPDHQIRKKLLTRTGQLNAETNGIVSRRNAMTHTAFEDWGGPTLIAISPHKASKLRNEDHIRYLTELIEDTTLLLINLADLRDMFIDWLDPGSRERSNEIMRRAGYRVLEDERNKERERLLQAVALRTPPPPLPSAE